MDAGKQCVFKRKKHNNAEWWRHLFISEFKELKLWRGTLLKTSPTMLMWPATWLASYRWLAVQRNTKDHMFRVKSRIFEHRGNIHIPVPEPSLRLFFSNTMQLLLILHYQWVERRALGKRHVGFNPVHLAVLNAGKHVQRFRSEDKWGNEPCPVNKVHMIKRSQKVWSKNIFLQCKPDCSGKVSL